MQYAVEEKRLPHGGRVARLRPAAKGEISRRMEDGAIQVFDNEAAARQFLREYHKG